MPPDFYSDRDKQIYEQYQYVPQEEYLQRPFQFPTQEEEETPASSSGISTLPVYMGGGGGGAPADVTNLLFDFKGATDTRQNRLENPNPLFNFLGKIVPQQRSVDQMIRDSQEYNRGITASRPDSPLNQKIMDYIKANPNKSFSVDPYSKMSFGKQLNRYTDDQIRETNPELFVQQGMFKDPLDVRPQLPFGATGIMQAMLPDSYYDKMTMPQQIYTQSKMGYTGPTIFGENTTGGSKDVFGRNIRSGFGNYAEKQQRDIDKLDDYFSSDLFQERYGDTKLVQDEFGNYTFVNVNNPALAAKANQMNKLNLTRYNYDKQGLQELKGIEDETGFTALMEAQNIGDTNYGITEGVSDASYRSAADTRARSDATTPDDFGQSEGMVDGWED
tara:strand:+ start:1269 stop:2432 length:1164 start_codon:yes stop_codon:yes gene_type:complete